jgi:DNA primase
VIDLVPSPEQRTFFASAVSQYQRDLALDTNAQKYLASRGIRREIAERFSLGVVTNPLLGHEVYRGRLCLPYLTPSGVVSFVFRCLQDHVCKDVVLRVTNQGKEIHCKKYQAPEGALRLLYNVCDFKVASDTIYVCEGEIDALTLSACGFPAIGVPGAQNWKSWFARPFKDYVKVYCVADGDEAGYKLARLLSAEIDARILRPPGGEDINSLYVKGGEDGIRRWLAGAAG